MRRQPEDHGLLPDGDSTNPETSGLSADRSFSNERSLTLGHAVRTRAFWQLTIGFGLNQAALMTILIHSFPFVTESGFDRNGAAIGLSINGFGNLVSKVVWGWGLGRFSPRLLVPVAFGISATGVTPILTAGSLELGALLMVGFFFSMASDSAAPSHCPNSPGHDTSGEGTSARSEGLGIRPPC